MDTHGVGKVADEAMKAMESIELEYPDAEVGAVGVVVELLDGNRTVIEARSSDSRAWISAGLFRQAMRIFER